jgi:hypothetical protein
MLNINSFISNPTKSSIRQMIKDRLTGIEPSTEPNINSKRSKDAVDTTLTDIEIENIQTRLQASSIYISS